MMSDCAVGRFSNRNNHLQLVREGRPRRNESEPETEETSSYAGIFLHDKKRIEINQQLIDGLI